MNEERKEQDERKEGNKGMNERKKDRITGRKE